MTSFRIFLVSVFVLISLGVYAQQTYPISVYDGQTVETCTGIFTDSGGDFQTPYGPNEDFSVTFCSNDEQHPVLDVFFEYFQLAQGDILYVYDGPDSSAPLLWEATATDLQGLHVYASEGCLHFRFVSSPSDQSNGWSAPMQCLSLCETFQASITPQAGTFEYCPETGDITLLASSAYLPENLPFNPSQVSYQWLVDGTPYTGSQVTHSFFNPGAYPITLVATDPTHGCEATVNEVIKLGTYPSFDGTIATVDTACAGETFSLLGMATPNIWTGFPTEVVETAAIPDGTGELYESSLVFDIFDEGDVILSAVDIDQVCINIEHAVNGQLQFELECPSGNRITLKDYGSGTSNLGEPVIWDNVTPGEGYNYCFSNEAAYGTMAQTAPQFHEYTDQAGNYYFNAAYLPAGSYTPDDHFNGLTGCPLNGEWTLRVKDQVPGDDGFIFSWSLYFREDFYPDSLIFFPEITQRRWYQNTNPLQGNPVAVFVEEPGDHTFRFEATDSFGCLYDTTVTVYIRPLPEAEILSELELPFCEGDSTLLTVSAINNATPLFSYQWSFNNVEIPGAVYDTLMAKTPGTYTVQVTDEETACFDFFDLDVTQQNCDLTIPNVFTPNGDGINDYFEILNLEYYQAEMVIFNRWGKKVYEHSDYFNNWWDGEGAPDGTYFYILTYSRGEERKNTEGVITIVR
ncbi:MAG: gliding motility-associated C-terminal domain-containing protein [Bacteroides sp.]|nr:gliding motility-associated C-terminal domain-containing protein [Bacteroides sp.]